MDPTLSVARLLYKTLPALDQATQCHLLGRRQAQLVHASGIHLRQEPIRLRIGRVGFDMLVQELPQIAHLFWAWPGTPRARRPTRTLPAEPRPAPVGSSTNLTGPSVPSVARRSSSSKPSRVTVTENGLPREKRTIEHSRSMIGADPEIHSDIPIHTNPPLRGNGEAFRPRAVRRRSRFTRTVRCLGPQQHLRCASNRLNRDSRAGGRRQNLQRGSTRLHHW